MNFIPKSSFVFLIFAFNTFALCQSNLNSNKYISKTFWIRHNLVLSGKVKIFPNNIEFEKTDGAIINRGEQIKIDSINENHDFSTVRFSSKNEAYEVLIKSNSKKVFDNSFDLVFSTKPISDSLINLYCESKMKTRTDLLRCFGFPLKIDLDEESKIETFHYTCWFLNHCISLDTYQIKVKNGKIVDILGTI